MGWTQKVCSCYPCTLVSRTAEAHSALSLGGGPCSSGWHQVRHPASASPVNGDMTGTLRRNCFSVCNSLYGVAWIRAPYLPS